MTDCFPILTSTAPDKPDITLILGFVLFKVFQRKRKQMLEQTKTEHYVNAVCSMGKYIILCQSQYQLINVHDSNSYRQYISATV